VHQARHLASKKRRDFSCQRDQSLQVNIASFPDALQEVHEVFGADVAGRDLREGASSKSGKGRLKASHADLHRGVRVRHSHSERVVEMTSAFHSRICCEDLFEQSLYLEGLCVPGRIGEADVLQPGVQVPADDRQNALDGYRTFEAATESGLNRNLHPPILS
jgi:hypothetical protein